MKLLVRNGFDKILRKNTYFYGMEPLYQKKGKKTLRENRAGLEV